MVMGCFAPSALLERYHYRGNPSYIPDLVFLEQGIAGTCDTLMGMDTFLLIGLGNVGSDFEYTRHNVGVRMLRQWFDSMEKSGYQVAAWWEDRELVAQVASVHLSAAKKVWCLFPLTMMNDSGEAVVRFLRNHPVDTSRLLVIHDDLETSFGEVRLNTAASAKGHNGVRSIHDKLATQDMARLLVGIGRPSAEVTAEKFVLQKFSVTEEEILSADIMPQAMAAITEFVGI